MRPDLLYVSLSGFGERGPYAGKRVYDPVVQALSGLADVQRDRDTGRPRMMRLIVPDKVTALLSRELALIEDMGVEAFFLTVHDLVVFARSAPCSLAISSEASASPAAIASYEPIQVSTSHSGTSS